jgi:hypothetical protein
MDGRKCVRGEAEYSVYSLQLNTRNFFDSFVVIVRKRHVTQIIAKLAELWVFLCKTRTHIQAKSEDEMMVHGV